MSLCVSSHEFSVRSSHEANQCKAELEGVRDDFALKFRAEYSWYAANKIYNVDETAIYYEMFPVDCGWQRECLVRLE